MPFVQERTKYSKDLEEQEQNAKKLAEVQMRRLLSAVTDVVLSDDSRKMADIAYQEARSNWTREVDFHENAIIEVTSTNLAALYDEWFEEKKPARSLGFFFHTKPEVNCVARINFKCKVVVFFFFLTDGLTLTILLLFSKRVTSSTTPNSSLKFGPVVHSFSSRKQNHSSRVRRTF